MPQLYSADLLESAKPVKGKEPEKIKKPATDKQLAALAKAQETRKRKKAEKDALKEQESTKEKEIQQLEQAKLEQAEAKKRAAAEKRKATRDAKKLQQPSPPASKDGNVDTETEASTAVADKEVEPKKRKRASPDVVPSTQASDSNEPPGWFKKYISGVKKEENAAKKVKLPKKQVDQEVEEVAHKQWGDGYVRDRLRNEVDGHMNRMYGMIFGQRRMI